MKKTNKIKMENENNVTESMDSSSIIDEEVVKRLRQIDSSGTMGDLDEISTTIYKMTHDFRNDGAYVGPDDSLSKEASAEHEGTAYMSDPSKLLGETDVENMLGEDQESEDEDKGLEKDDGNESGKATPVANQSDAEVEQDSNKKEDGVKESSSETTTTDGSFQSASSASKIKVPRKFKFYLDFNAYYTEGQMEDIKTVVEKLKNDMLRETKTATIELEVSFKAMPDIEKINKDAEEANTPSSSKGTNTPEAKEIDSGVIDTLIKEFCKGVIVSGLYDPDQKIKISGETKGFSQAEIIEAFKQEGRNPTSLFDILYTLLDKNDMYDDFIEEYDVASVK